MGAELFHADGQTDMKLIIEPAYNMSTFYLCIYIYLFIYFRVVGPCHHGMARPQVAYKGTASDKEGSCEYI